MDIDVVIDAAATIGESATWSPVERALYWIDVKKPALFRYHPATGAQRSWHVTSDISAFALLSDTSGAIVALREGMFRLDFATGDLTLLAPAPFDPWLFRFNEGGCDPLGRFWVGVMYDPIGPAGPAQSGALHSFTLRDGLREQPDAAELHNGMAWSADGTRFYLAHSNRQEVFAYDFDAENGRLGERRTFATVPASVGLPDGAAVDTLEGYWLALHGGGKLRRYTATGETDREIALPVSQPTMCAFGGDDLADLYVTSASDKLSDEQKRREPLAGALLRLRPGERGISRPLFG
jgi:sugar lactone lactonase YvrE